MKTKRVLRYYCEYCKKSGCSKRHIRHHEERCTLNPNRVCGYCKFLEREQPKIIDLLALLPNPDDFKWYSSTFTTAVEESLPKLREATESCPACIMAALRQKGIPVPIATNFDFKKECQKIWDEINRESWKRDLESTSY